MPGCCIRVQFVPPGTSSHTETFVEYGKRKEGHDAILYGAKTLVGTVCDILNDPALLPQMWADFEDAKAKA